jgi:hypothetical protein
MLPCSCLLRQETNRSEKVDRVHSTDVEREALDINAIRSGLY